MTLPSLVGDVTPTQLVMGVVTGGIDGGVLGGAEGSAPGRVAGGVAGDIADGPGGLVTMTGLVLYPSPIQIN